MFYDMHCHIDLFESPERMVREIEKKCVATIAVTNTPEMYRDCLVHLRGCRYIKPALGLHPNAKVDRIRELRRFEKLAKGANCIGEIGLDGRSPRDSWREQEYAFEKILEVIHGQKCMVTVHSRGREKVVLECLRRAGMHGVIFHWYTGPKGLIEDIVADGHFFSVNLAMMSHSSSRKKIALFPRERVLTESDGPFAKHRKRRLSPIDMKDTVAELARLWGMSAYEAEKAVAMNVSSLAKKNGVFWKAFA